MAFEYFPSMSTTLDSPPPLIFSDNSSEDFEVHDQLDNIMDKDDVSTVMAKVLGHLTRIAEHLREKGENDAANDIAKQTISIVNTFNDATASWDIQKCLMSPSPLRRAESSLMTEAAVVPGKAFVGGSWAAVAATATADNNQLVKFRPCDALKRNVTVETPVTSEDDLRVVWVQPWEAKKKLNTVTERLNHGALLSMAYSEADGAVCIIFQHTYQAQALLEDNAECLRRFCHGLFGPQCQVLPGQAYGLTDDLQRMSPPLNERRRLTFARQALFTNGLSEERFKKDIYGIVGENNVELVWLFNTGNATVVFSATVIARLVRDEFRSRGRAAGPYKGVQVTFSHDPCERPMNLITQLPNGRAANGKASSQPTGYGNPNATPLGSAPSTRRGSTVATTPALVADTDGWQTVARRR